MLSCGVGGAWRGIQEAVNCHKVSLERDPSGERIRKGTTGQGGSGEKKKETEQHGYEDSEKNIEKLNPKSRRKRS